MVSIRTIIKLVSAAAFVAALAPSQIGCRPRTIDLNSIGAVTYFDSVKLNGHDMVGMHLPLFEINGQVYGIESAVLHNSPRPSAMV